MSGFDTETDPVKRIELLEAELDTARTRRDTLQKALNESNRQRLLLRTAVDSYQNCSNDLERSKARFVVAERTLRSAMLECS